MAEQALLDGGPHYETGLHAESAAAGALMDSVAYFTSMNQDLMLGDSVLLHQVYTSEDRGELKPVSHHRGENKFGMYTITLNNDAHNPSFTVIEAEAERGRRIVYIEGKHGYVSQFDAQGRDKGVSILGDEEHQEYLGALRHFLESDLMRERIYEIGEQRLKAERALGAFIIEPVVEFTNTEGKRAKTRAVGKVYDRMKKELEGRIAKIGFTEWPPVGIQAAAKEVA